VRKEVVVAANVVEVVGATVVVVGRVLVEVVGWAARLVVVVVGPLELDSADRPKNTRTATMRIPPTIVARSR
jgi:hypothetical protein